MVNFKIYMKKVVNIKSMLHSISNERHVSFFYILNNKPKDKANVDGSINLAYLLQGHLRI